MVRLTEIDIVSLALSIYLFSSLKIVLITLLLGQKFNFKHIIISIPDASDTLISNVLLGEIKDVQMIYGEKYGIE